jgi:hypothetical protein
MPTWIRIPADLRRRPTDPVPGFKEFGAATCFYVLEHLGSPAAAERALRELQRVAEYVYVCSPKRWHPDAVVRPEHALWVNHHPDGSISFEQR